MSIRIFTLLLLIFSLFGCAENERKQFEYSGGGLRMALDHEPSTFIARNATDYYSAVILSQVMEGLVSLDPKNSTVTPQLAKSWQKSADGLTYTFTLREDVLFHPHDQLSASDRKFTAKDVIKSFEIACTKDENGDAPSTYSYAFKGLVEGADDFFNGNSKTITGITSDGNTITFQLLHSDNNFLYKLAHINATISSHKLIGTEYESDVIGTGPFMYANYQDGEVPRMILVKNNEYYLEDENGNALPYLDSLVMIFQSRKLEQLDMFEAKQIDLIAGLPTSRITRMLEGKIEDFNSKPPKLILANNPLLESNFYFFNLNDERFKDPKVRQAFNYAVNKEFIGREILRNQYYDLGYYGITPPVSRALKGYDFKSIRKNGYDYDPDKARKLLAEAGYPNGEGFGSVNLRFNINDVHSAVADEFSKQIAQVLGININIDGSTFEQLQKDWENGNGDIFRMGWSADYPSPETFLMNFYGKNVPEDPTMPSKLNYARYVNPIFDQFYDSANAAEKKTDQMKFFSKAEMALMENPPIIPLWYTGDIEITYSYIRDFHFNALNTYNFTRVYLKDWTAEEYQAEISSEN